MVQESDAAMAKDSLTNTFNTVCVLLLNPDNHHPRQMAGTHRRASNWSEFHTKSASFFRIENVLEFESNFADPSERRASTEQDEAEFQVVAESRVPDRRRRLRNRERAPQIAARETNAPMVVGEAFAGTVVTIGLAHTSNTAAPRTESVGGSEAAASSTQWEKAASQIASRSPSTAKSTGRSSAFPCNTPAPIVTSVREKTTFVTFASRRAKRNFGKAE
jgi:hypothetical protein